MFKIQMNTLISFEDEDVVDGVLTIPEGVETIKSINNYCLVNKTIKKIVLPKTVKTIEEYAFSSEVFRSAESIQLNDGLEKIEMFAFFLCMNLKEIIIPNTVKEIGESAFKNCKMLEKVVLPQDLKVLEREVFYGCEEIIDITLPQNLEKICEEAFCFCDINKPFVLPSSVKLIEESAFYGVHKVEVVVNKQELINNKSILICLKPKQNRSFSKQSKLIENEKEYIIRFNTDNLQHYNSFAHDFYVLGDTAKLKQLFNNKTDLPLSHNVVSALHNDLKNNEKIDMHFYNLLLKDYGTDISKIDSFAYDMGLFKGTVSEKRISKSGNEILENVNYSHKIYELLKSLNLYEQKFSYFEEFKKLNCKFKPEFAKFVFDKDNFSRLIDMELMSLGFIAKCYDKFEQVQKTNSSNKGSQRQLKPTIEKFYNYFDKQKFNDTLGYEELADYVGEYYDSQETFELAKKIIKKQKDNNVPKNITKNSVIEQKQEKIEEHKKSILNNAVKVVKNLMQIAENEFTYEFLDKHDYANLLLGKMCNCCAHLEGAGEGLVNLSMLHPDFQNLVIRDNKNNIIAKSTLYVNREQGYGVFNNVEISAMVDKSEYKKIYKKYIQAVEHFVSIYNQENPNNRIKQINVGMGNNDLGVQIIDHNKKGKVLETLNVLDYSDKAGFYMGDAKDKQYILYKEKPSKDSKEKE